MQGSGIRVEIEREELDLLPERALFWPSQSALLVADLHIGKGAAFRAGAIPVPSGSSEATLSRLTDLLHRTVAKRLLILGDLWHAKQGRTDQIHALLNEWRSRCAGIEMLLVEGNHDVKSGALPDELEIRTASDFEIGPFILKHHPKEDSRGYVLCGHVHPGVRLIGQGRQVAHLPAFVFGSKVGVLPAFGEFTGAFTVYPSPQDRVFVVADSEVIEVATTTAASAI